MNKIFKIFLVSLLATFASAQSYTSVTATLVDSNSQVWANASWRAELVPPFGNPATPVNQGHATLPPQSGFTDGSGAFSTSLDDNLVVQPTGTTWRFTICPNATVSSCSVSVQVVHGASMNLGPSISADLVSINVSAAPTVFRAYQDAEVNAGQGAIYWRVSDNTLRGCSGVCQGTNWINVVNSMTNGIITSPTFNTSINQGSGLKHQLFNGGCTTSTAQYSLCTDTVNWTTAFADANYTVVCSIESSSIGIPLILGINKFSANMGIVIANMRSDSIAAQVATYDCQAMHL